jgi:hypothetical protein
MISRLRILALAPLAVLVLFSAGCGGAQNTGLSAAPGAQLVRDDTLVFVSVNTDTSSSQWRQLDTLSQKFPGRDQAIAQLERNLAGQGVSYQNDIKPALGPEFDFVLGTGGGSLNDMTAIGLTKPEDPAKFVALAKKSDQGSTASVTRKLDNGWYAVSDNQADIDRLLRGNGDALADSTLYNNSLSKLPDDALAKAYVNGPQLARIVHEALQQRGGGSFSGTTSGLDKLEFISASLGAEDDGVRLHGAVQGSGASALTGAGDYSSKLLGEAPSDAFAFLSFQSAKSLGAGLGQLSAPLELALGVSLQDVLPLFQNENALWVRPGAVIPEFTAILQPDDTSAGLATLNKLVEKLAASGGATVTGGAEKTISFGKQFQLHYGAVGSKLVLTSAPGGIQGVGSPSENLGDSADFKEATGAAGMPSSNGGFLYVDLKNAIPLIEGFASLSSKNLPTNVTANLRPLRSFLEWSAGSGDARTFDAFLEIK